MSRAAAKVSLVWVLLGAVVVDLVVGRFLPRLLSVSEPTAESWLPHAVAFVGAFAANVVGTLAAILCSWGVWRMVRERGLLGGPTKGVLAITAIAFLPLASASLLRTLSPPLIAALLCAFAGIVSVLVLIYLRQAGCTRSKVGIFYVAVPIVLCAYRTLSSALPLLAIDGTQADLPARLYGVAAHMAVVNGFMVLFLFVPTQRLGTLFTLGPQLMAVFAAALAALIINRYPMAALSFYDALGLPLRLPRLQAGEIPLFLIHLGSLFCYVLGMATLFWRNDAYRGTAIGLVLVSATGLQLHSAPHLLAVCAGVLQILRAGLAPQTIVKRTPQGTKATRPSAEQISAFLQRLSASLTASTGPTAQAVVIQHDGNHIARVAGKADGLPFSVRLLLHDDVLREVEVDVGQPPKDEAVATMVRCHERRGGRVPDGKGPRRHAFDPRFALRATEDQLLDKLHPFKEELGQEIHGWLGLWPAEGLRYLCRPLGDGWPVPLSDISSAPASAPLEPMQRLVQLLVRMAQALDVR